MATIQRPSLMSRVRRGPSLPTLVREEPLLFVGVLISALVYLAYEVLNHAHYQTNGYDLGIFDQGMWHLSRFETPGSTIEGVSNILGDHFSPILLLLVPFYWIWANPFMLFLAEATAIAASMVPIFLVIRARVDRLPAYLLVASYALFWGIQSGVDFAFREVAFIPLLIGLIVLAVDLLNWRLYAVSIFALLLVRENEGVLVAFIGLYVVLRGHFRQGLLTMVAGPVWFLVTIKVVMPALLGGAPFRHWIYPQFGSGPGQALRIILAHPFRVLDALTDQSIKARTIVLSFVPFLFLPLFSPIIVLTIPLFAERMLSDLKDLWGPGFHYSLPIAAVLVIGAADGLRNLTSFPSLVRKRRLIAIACGVASLYLAVMIGRTFSFRQLGSPSFYAQTAADRAANDGVAIIPSSASVAAEDTTLPHLSGRANAFLLAQAHPLTDFVIIDLAHYPSTPQGVANAIITMKPRYGAVYRRENFLVFKRLR